MIDIVVIDIVVIDIAVIDVVVIDAMSAIFRLPKSTKFKSFQMLSSSFMASYSYCEKSLTALTRERRKGHHLSVQYDVIYSTYTSNNKITFVSQKNKTGSNKFLEKQVINQFWESKS